MEHEKGPHHHGRIYTFVHHFFFYALAKRLHAGYTKSDLKADLIAGLNVALVAIPLNLSFAIATGVPPQFGLYTAIIAGFFVALMGGSQFQVTGPTAAFVVILLPIVHQHGPAGLMIASFMAGIFIMIMGFSRMGKVIQSTPYPVTIGFTSGIAVVIFSIQIKDLLGLTLPITPESFIDRWHLYYNSIATFQLKEFFVGIFTLIALLTFPKFNKKIPAPIIIIPIATLLVFLLNRFDLAISTIESSFSYLRNGQTFGGIPSGFSSFIFPWDQLGAHGEKFNMSFSTLKELMVPSLAVAMLGAIVTLLSAVVADGIGKGKHNPNSELVAVGIGNMITPFFSGIPASGAIARTIVGIRFGTKSPIMAMSHAIIMLIVLLTIPSVLSKLPMASLAALLISVSITMFDHKRFLYFLRVSPKSDVSVLLACLMLTVTFDMVVGVTVGVFLASVLFMRRTIELSHGEVFNKKHISHLIHESDIPDDVILYKIVGPMFFGVADKVFSALQTEVEKAKAVIILMDQVPTIDATGLVAFENTIRRIVEAETTVALVGLQPHAQKVLHKGTQILHNRKVIEFLSLESAVRFIQITR